MNLYHQLSDIFKIKVQLNETQRKNQLQLVKMRQSAFGYNNQPPMPKHTQNVSKKSTTRGKLQHFLFFEGCNEKNSHVVVEVDFTPVKAFKAEGKLSQFPIIPRFNNDRKFYTPAFFNPFEGLDDDGILLKNHQSKLTQIDQKQHACQILIPKPRKHHPNCGVCGVVCEDYLTHIESREHRQQLKNSQTNQDIKNLIKVFFKKNKMIAKKCNS